MIKKLMLSIPLSKRTCCQSLVVIKFANVIHDNISCQLDFSECCIFFKFANLGKLESHTDAQVLLLQQI